MLPKYNLPNVGCHWGLFGTGSLTQSKKLASASGTQITKAVLSKDTGKKRELYCWSILMFSGDAAQKSQKWVRKNENYVCTIHTRQKSWYFSATWVALLPWLLMGSRVLTDLGQKNRTCTYGLDSDYISSYIYLFVEKLCPMAVAGCNSTWTLYGIKVINMPTLNVIIKLVLIKNGWMGVQGHFEKLKSLTAATT